MRNGHSTTATLYYRISDTFNTADHAGVEQSITATGMHELDNFGTQRAKWEESTIADCLIEAELLVLQAYAYLALYVLVSWITSSRSCDQLCGCQAATSCCCVAL